MQCATPDPSEKWLPADGSGDQWPSELARRTQGDKKYHMIFATNFITNCYYELLTDGGNVDSDRFVEFIHNAINHFNACMPVLAVTHAYIENVRLKLLLQPPYSPDTNVCGRYVFRNYETCRFN